MLNQQGQVVSGHAYIAVHIRGDESKRTSMSGGIVVAAPQNCLHITTVCETAECLNSWSLDYQMFLKRTVRGRKIAKRFHLTEDQLDVLSSTEFREINRSADPFDAQYDRPVTRSGQALD